MSTLSTVKREEDGGASAESKNSSAPLLDKSQQEPGANLETDPNARLRKRDFWKLGKKPEEKEQKQSASPELKASASQGPPMVGLRPSSPFRMPDSVGGAGHRGSIPYASPGSPGHALAAGMAPRPHSPASSMIFERNVQDETHPPDDIAQQIPSHVITENHIPPALDASTEAITNSKLNPDEVEIITHATHQPAAVTITGAGMDQSMESTRVDEQQPAPLIHRQSEPGQDDMSGYGSLDSADVRRLSFISFADVVHAEQEGIGNDRRDSAALASNMVLGSPRSPSPMRSPVSSQAYGTSPPTSIATSARGFEGSPNRGIRATAGSPPLAGQASPMPAGDLNIETMRQALRRTGSGDLSGVRSAPLSAVEGENFSDKSLR